jgi:hypothetical protein
LPRSSRKRSTTVETFRPVEDAESLSDMGWNVSTSLRLRTAGLLHQVQHRRGAILIKMLPEDFSESFFSEKLPLAAEPVEIEPNIWRMKPGMDS